MGKSQTRWGALGSAFLAPPKADVWVRRLRETFRQTPPHEMDGFSLPGFSLVIVEKVAVMSPSDMATQFIDTFGVV